MSSITFTHDENWLILHVEQTGRAVLEGAQAGIEATLNEVKDELSQEGDPVAYPINWDSEKQRRAFFATNGFGKGIPYERTGEMEHGYVVTPLGDSYTARARLSNAVPWTRYVMGNSLGERQSRIHLGRWDIFRTVVLDYIPVFVGHIRREIEARLSGGSK